MSQQDSHTSQQYQDLLDMARECALSAGELIRSGFGTAFSIANKEGKHNLVTEYDTRSEQHIITKIRARFPDHMFLAEESFEESSDESSADESALSNNSHDTVEWIIDPIDGTVNYAHGIPIFCVSIAARLRGDIVAGVIYQPMTNELFTAQKGGGAFLNGERLRVSSTARLSDALLVTGFPYNVHENPIRCIDHMSMFLSMGLPVRRLGSAALDLAYLSAGRFDAYWEVSLKPWDVAAGMLLLLEAGGKISHYDGTPYRIGKPMMLASNGLLHDEMSAKLCSLL